MDSEIVPHLPPEGIGSRLILLDEIGSTNTHLLELPEAETPEGTVVAAEHQTSGRGRHGRIWFAPPRVNLLFSVLLHEPGDSPGLLTLAGACAATDSLRNMEINVSLKWPNDIVAENLKLGGILCENRTLSSGRSRTVLGMGLNVNWPRHRFPEEIRNRATSVMELLARPVDRGALFVDILHRLQAYWNELRSGDSKNLISRARTVCHTLGQHIRVRLGNRILEGTAVDLDEGGRLVFRLDSGAQRVLELGEILEAKKID